MNAVFNINKPAGMTSNDVVCIMRKILNMKKVGHGGTLDPDATGVLPVFTGNATRLLEFALDGTKEYVADFLFGKKTDTGDVSGKILASCDVPKLSEEDIKKVLQKFLGKQEQIPPMYSAIKMQGKKLYQMARRGEEVERQPREIEIFSIELIKWESPVLKIKVECSKGTYIRVLGEDIAKSLGTLATMQNLIRTRVGNFNLQDAYTLEEIKNNSELCGKKPIDAVQLVKLKVTAKQAYRLTSGVATTICGTKDGKYAVLGPGDEFLAVAVAENEIIKVQKVLEQYANCE